MRPKGEKPPGRLFTFRSAGWVLLLAGIVGSIVVWRTLAILDQRRQESFGDGKNVETYKFALEPSLIDQEHLVAANMPRNGARAMTDPGLFTISEMKEHVSRRIRKLLVSDDRVVGVEIGGEARAYPLRILNWHEVANDTVGGVPIAVTYHPLCDSVVVFDRRMGEETIELRVSGLLWNSSQLLFLKREEAGGESLWSQLQARAVTGPDAAAGKRLTVLPSVVVRWGDWKSRHPDTTILGPERAYMRQYPSSPYSNYFGTRALRFKIDSARYPPPGTGDGWDRVLVVKSGEEQIVVSDYDGVPPSVPADEVFHAFRWAWHATRPAAAAD